MDVELRHLRSFVAVAEELNFTRAAERLHLAQPALSAHVRQLEARIGAQLLERTTRRGDFTPEGAALLASAPAAIAAIEDAVRAAQAAAAGEAGEAGLVTEPLFDDERVVVLGASHPLAARPSLDAREVARQPFVHVADVDPVTAGFWTLRRDRRPVPARRRHPSSARRVRAGRARGRRRGGVSVSR